MAREVLRTKTFANDAANFILTKAREALDERQQFRIRGSGGLFFNWCKQRSEINRADFFRRPHSSGRAGGSKREKRNLDYRTEIVIRLF